MFLFTPSLYQCCCCPADTFGCYQHVCAGVRPSFVCMHAVALAADMMGFANRVHVVLCSFKGHRPAGDVVAARRVDVCVTVPRCPLGVASQLHAVPDTATTACRGCCHMRWGKAAASRAIVCACLHATAQPSLAGHAVAVYMPVLFGRLFRSATLQACQPMLLRVVKVLPLSPWSGRSSLDCLQH